MPDEVAMEFAMALDPAVLFRRGLGFPPDEFQLRVLRSSSRRLLWAASRQSGKSVTAAAIAVHTARYGPAGGLVVVVSPALRQSVEMVRTCTQILRNVGEQAGEPTGATDATMLKITLSNSARILALPAGEAGETIRGYTARLLVLDECAILSDDTIASVTPMLAATGGRLLAISTPRGRQGFFWRAFESDDPGYERIRVRADQCARISPEFLDQERRSMSAARYAAEYDCEFTSTEFAIWDPATIDAATRGDVVLLEGIR